MSLLFLSACQSVPTNIELLEEARHDYLAALADPSVRELAGAEMRHADAAMLEADRSWYRNEDVDQTTHWASLAKQSVALAQARRAEKCAELLMPGAGAPPPSAPGSTVRACEHPPSRVPAP